MLSLDRDVLDSVIDDARAGRLPKTSAGKTSRSQGQVDLTLTPDGAIVQALAFESRSRPGARAAARIDAEAVLVARSRDTQQLAALTLGYQPTTREGKRFVLSADGVKDPTWGTPNHPLFPRLPVAGSALEKLVRNVTRIKAGASLDSEESILNVDASFVLRGPREQQANASPK